MSPSRPLLRHPDSPGLGIRALDVTVERLPDGGLILRYTLTGALEALRVSASQPSASQPSASQPSAPKPPIREEGLWRTTCLECFIREGDGPAYREFNFAPSGAWQAYAFSEYRQGGALETDAVPEIRCETGPLQLHLTARLPAVLLPPEPGRLAISAVLQSRDGRLAYWALRHPEGKADFHHNDGFVLNCPAP